MHKKSSPKLATTSKQALTSNYESMLTSMIELLENARRIAARAVNSVMTASYWEVGRRIVEIEQGGARRADYGAVWGCAQSDVCERLTNTPQ